MCMGMKKSMVMLVSMLSFFSAPVHAEPLGVDAERPLIVLSKVLAGAIGEIWLTKEESAMMIRHISEESSHDAKLLTIYALAYSNESEAVDVLQNLQKNDNEDIACMTRWAIRLKKALKKNKAERIGLVVNFIDVEKNVTARLFAVNWLLCVERSRMPSLHLVLYDIIDDGAIKREMQQVILALYPNDNEYDIIWRDIKVDRNPDPDAFGEIWPVIMGHITPKRMPNEYEMKWRVFLKFAGEVGG